jgi:hypothetical protein
MEEEREIQEQTQTARGNAADEREPLQEAVRLAEGQGFVAHSSAVPAVNAPNLHAAHGDEHCQ